MALIERSLGREMSAARLAAPMHSPCSNTISPRSIVAMTTPRSRAPSYGVTAMAMIEARRIDGHLAIGIEDHEVGVVARRDGALAPAETGEPRRRGGHPLGEAMRSECAAAAAPVQTTGSEICSDAMPPQAARKSPSSMCLSAAGAGE